MAEDDKKTAGEADAGPIHAWFVFEAQAWVDKKPVEGDKGDYQAGQLVMIYFEHCM